MPAHLKDKLREHRKKLGFSLDDLARLSGSSKSYLWELENRETRNPSAEKLAKIAAVLQVTTAYLLDEHAEMDDNHLKEVFFRKYNRLEEGDKRRIQDMIEAWGKKK